MYGIQSTSGNVGRAPGVVSSVVGTLQPVASTSSHVVLLSCNGKRLRSTNSSQEERRATIDVRVQQRKPRDACIRPRPLWRDTSITKQAASALSDDSFADEDLFVSFVGTADTTHVHQLRQPIRPTASSSCGSLSSVEMGTQMSPIAVDGPSHKDAASSPLFTAPTCSREMHLRSAWTQTRSLVFTATTAASAVTAAGGTITTSTCTLPNVSSSVSTSSQTTAADASVGLREDLSEFLASLLSLLSH
jgi:hypothetical protein